MSLLPDALADQRVRGYLYRVLTAAGGLAVFYGLMTAEEAVMWAGFVATLFVVPAYNTPLKDKG